MPSIDGVRLRTVIEFGRQVPPEASTRDVVRDVIVKQTRKAKYTCRYVDLLPPGDRGVPSAFVSHSWDDNFHALLTSLRKKYDIETEEDLRGPKASTFVYLDIFAVNQNLAVSDQQAVRVCMPPPHTHLATSRRCGCIWRRRTAASPPHTHTHLAVSDQQAVRGYMEKED